MNGRKQPCGCQLQPRDRRSRRRLRLASRVPLVRVVLVSLVTNGATPCATAARLLRLGALTPPAADASSADLCRRVGGFERGVRVVADRRRDREVAAWRQRAPPNARASGARKAVHDTG